jgi:hypothetical protein
LAKPRARPKPTTGAALRAQVRAKNRWMAIGMASFAIAVFVGVLAATVINEHYLQAQRHDAAKHAAAASPASEAR